MPAPTNPPPPTDAALQSLVAACIEARGSGGAGAVDALLRQHPALATAARAQLAHLRRAGLLDDTDVARAASSHHEGPRTPDAIGPYRILEPLGHGGMGTVYLAEQREPVRRRVALKLIKLGMDTREVVARFGAERQALAMMNHVNIAKVLDAGSTDDGRPYFVMEHVAGLPITQYCDRHQLGTRQRLAVFLAACDGVQHAHWKGIIHRDIKPTNVLVAEQDGAPLPKIIDFGVAKAMGQSLTDATLHTHAGMVVGTPEYMSPEQAGRDALDIDTRSDVYSLGVLLYELLTGSLPFASARLRTDLVEMRRILREEEPPTPSQRVRPRDETAATAAAHRATTAPALHHQLRGDLDWICLKALEKERDRRYPTVHDLMADIRRHLASEPVLASPPSRWYRARKFVRRNRLQVGAASAVTVALIGGLVASIAYSRRAADAAATARQALQGESAARTAAETNFERALAAVDRLLLRVADSELADVPQMESTRRALLGDALAFYRELVRERQDDPRARLAAARAKIAVARLSNLLSDPHAAETAAREAIAELRAVVAQQPAGAVYAHQADAQCHLADACLSLGKAEAARGALDTAVDELQRADRERPDDRAIRLALAGALQHRGHFLATRDLPASMADLRAAVAHAQELAAAGHEDARETWVRCRLVLYRVMLSAGQILDAEKELLALRAELAAQPLGSPANAATREPLIATLSHLFYVNYTTGRYAEAEATARDELALREAMLAEHVRTPRRRIELAGCHRRLGMALLSNERPGEAEQFRAGVRVLEQLVAEFPVPAQYRAALARESYNHATYLVTLSSRAELVEARTHVERAIALLLALLRDDPTSHEHATSLASSRALLAGILRSTGDAAGALPVAATALRECQALAASHKESPVAWHEVACAAVAAADLALELRDFAAARRALDLGFDAVQKARALSDANAQYRHSHTMLHRLSGLCFAQAGDHAAAAASVDALLECGAGDRRTRIAAGDVLRLAWQAAGRTGLAAEEYAERARAHYATAAEALAAELASAPGDPVLLYHLACARLGGAELDAGRVGAGETIATLADALRVLRPEFDHGALDALLAEQIRAGYVLLAETSLAAGDQAGARAAAEELLAISGAAAEACFTAACLLGRCAQAAGGDDASRCEAAAVGALRTSVEAGFRDVARIEGANALDAVRRSAAGQAVLQELRTRR